MSETIEKIFSSNIVSLASLSEYRFTIPTYQRPFVWGDEHLKKLLDDFYQSFANDPEKVYYISTFLTKDSEKLAELIDGQQRFTSLWLIAFAISKICPDSQISNFLMQEKQLRLSFDIREEVGNFLSDLLVEEKNSKRIYDEAYIEAHPYLRNIAKALVFINGYLKQLPMQTIKPFGDYIYQKVQLIKNTAPLNTDLNKLFSTINSAGVQLEQTDIIKANLLKRLDNKVMYGKIWEACENMNNFFERNARYAFPSSNWQQINLVDFVAFDESIFIFQNDVTGDDANTDLFSIDTIVIESLGTYEPPGKISLNEAQRESEEIYCRSIINFGQLLLHTFRIHLIQENLPDFEGTFHVNRLITIFRSMEDRNNPDEIKRFFRLLWKVRYLFDKYVIKWVSDLDSKTESLELVNFRKNEKSYYSRTRYAKSSSLMLQSVLYFTGDYLRQYWLTTYLGYLLTQHQNLAATSSTHLKYLEEADNIFSLDTAATDKELSRRLLEKQNENHIDISKFEFYLNSPHGTAFKHYWFQKLEYVLWKNWENEKTAKFENFRISSKNSVEHIYPQHPEITSQKPKLIDAHLHAFGNLVLLSVSQNSEYTNKPFSVKKSMFREKSETYDSLKSYYIFQNEDWNPEKILDHQAEMIEKLIKHYNQRR